MDAIAEAATEVDQTQLGLYHKFNVTRTDGQDQPGGKHFGDEYLVLNLTTDRNVWPAVAAYAKKCEEKYPLLAADLRAKIAAHATASNIFITVPETILPEITLPSGKVIAAMIVPSFRVGKYLSTLADGNVIISADAVPTVDISYFDAVATCATAGLSLLRESQALALAWNIYNVDANWTGGKVGEGSLFQGLRKESVDEVQSNDYEPDDADERRWFVLSNGEKIFDAAGHLFTWVFDDVQGDERGIVKQAFSEDSRSLVTAPHPSMQKGMGWRPDAGSDWSGHALIRGGCWASAARAGVFRLDRDWPDCEVGGVGFRCTN